MSLTGCIKKAGEFLHKDDRDAIMAAARKYRGTGMSADDAGRQAIRDQIAVVEALLARPAANDAPEVPENTVFTESAAAAARAVLKRKLGTLNSGIDPELMQAGITLAGYHIERGARTFAAYAKKMLDDLGDTARPYLKSWYMAVKYDPRAAAFEGMDSAATVEAADEEPSAEPAPAPTGATGGTEAFGKAMRAAGLEPDGVDARSWSSYVGEFGEVHARMQDHGTTTYTVYSMFRGEDADTLSTVKLDEAAAGVARMREDLRKQEAAVTPATPAAADVPKLVEHVTGKGKTLRGVVRMDLTLDEARAIDQGTFRKNGGFFIRESRMANEQKPVQPEAIQPSATASTLTDFLASKIAAGGMPKDNPALRKLVELYDRQEPGQARMKEAQEALEAAIVGRAREIMATTDGDRRTFDALVDLYQSQPLLNIRTSTSIANQAYSTPAPLAFVASELAGINPGTTVLEPTAGTGMLLIGTLPSKAVVNELNPDRVALLRAQGFAKVSDRDATERVTSLSVDRVITNPPFGPIKDAAGESTKVKVDGYTLGQVDHLIAARALEAMKDDGRAVLIIGANKQTGQQSNNDLVFFNWLYGNYRVTSHFEVDGDLYERQGAGWPVRVIAIQGRFRSGATAPDPDTITRANNWSEVYEQFTKGLVANGPGAKPAASPVSARPVAADDAKPVPAAADGQAGQADSGRPAGRTPRAGDVAGERAGPVDDRGVPAGERVGGGDRQQRPDDADPVGRGLGGVDGGGRAAKPAGNPGSAGLTAAENQFQATYVARSSRKDDGVLIPVNMAGPTQDALNRLEDAVGDLDTFVQRELGYPSKAALHNAFMGLQVDSVAAAIHQIKQGKGVIIADQTGIGKGRQAAAVIRWAAKNGKTPVFVTVKPSLFTDMFGDLHDIGTDDVAPLIMNVDEHIKGGDDAKLFANRKGLHTRTLRSVAATGKLPEGRNALFMTYSQINVDNVQRTVVQSLAPNAVFVLDESHNAGGDSNTGEFIRGVLDIAAGVTYLSATYAKRPDNMPVYFKTDMGEAVADDEGLMSAMAAGGLPLQTVVANNLVKAGQMFRRERSYDGVSIESRADTKHGEEHRRLSDATTVALRSIVAADRAFHEGYVKQLQKELKKEGARALDMAGNQATKSVDHTQFTSIVHNFVRQMLLGLKAQEAADDAIRSLKRGEKPLIAVENTMGSFLSEYAAGNGVAVGDSLKGFGYRNVLSRALERTRFIVYQLPNGDKEKKFVSLGELDPATLQAYEKAQEIIDAIDINIPVSPIDWMRQEITKAGYTVAEITGRDLTVDYSDPKAPKLGQLDPREKKDKVRTTRLFNSGKLDALILNVAGSTGISLHASEKFTDQRQRHMIVAQAAQDINIVMQMLGRIHRTGQVALPKYTLLSADLPAEIRPTALLSGKMKSLNANTSSNTESATSVKAVDMLNKYGDRIVGQYLADNDELALELGVEGTVDGKDAPADTARTATGRLALMPVKVQAQFYAEVEEQYNALIDYLNKTNQNELEPSTFDFEAEERKSAVLFEGQNPESPFGEDAIYGEYSVKAQGKPMTPAEIRAAMAENLGGKDARQHGQEMIRRLEAAYTAYAAGLQGAQADNARAARDKGVQFLLQHPIGSMFRVDINGDVYNAAVINLRNTHKATGNPFSLSKFQVTVALNGALRSVTVPATQFNSITTSAITGYGSSIEREFREGPPNERETAKIVTGNLLGAYGELDGTRGSIISFTKADGTTEQGILLPKAFNYEKDTRQDYRLRTPADAIAFLQKSDHKDIGRFGINSRDGNVRVLPSGQGITIQVPKSKAKGGKYFLDKALLQAMGEEFVSQGSFMRATVDGPAAERALAVVMKKQALYALPSMADEARSIVGDEPSPKDAPPATPAFSRTAAATGMPPARVSEIVEAIRSRWANAPEVVVVENLQDEKVPERVRALDAEQQSQGASGAPEGFFYRGKVYLLADQLAAPKDVARVLMHESLGHFGLRGVYGDRLGPILDRLAVLNAGKVRAAAERLGLDFEAPAQRRMAAEEVLAYMAQETPEIGWVQRAVAAVRSWLRDNVPGFGTMKFTDADLIREFILPARAWVQRGPDGGPRGGGEPAPAFSREASTDTPAFRKWFGDSKVVDANGKPLVVYHGTYTDFSKFRGGGYFSADPEYSSNTAKINAEAYEGAAQVMPVFLSLQNPAERHVDFVEGIGYDQEAIAALEAQGYDGVMTPDKSEIYAFRSEQIKSAIGNRGTFDPADPNILFSRTTGLGNALTQGLNSVRDVQLPAGYKVADLLADVPGRLHWWHKTVGSMYNLAQQSEPFRKVYDGVQEFLNDVSFYAAEAADLAPRILPKLEHMSDVWKSPLSAADTKALAGPVFGGTLTWGRDAQGVARPMDDITADYADTSTEEKGRILLRAGKVTPEVLRMWEGLPIDQHEKIINGKFEREVLKAGVVFTPAELKKHFKLTDDQVGLYQEFRRATDRSLDNLAVSEMLRLAGKDGAPIRDAVQEAGSPRLAADMLREYLLSLADADAGRSPVLTETANKMLDIAARVEDLQREGYAPLSRFGTYTLEATLPDGERYFSLFETPRERARMQRTLLADGATDIRTGTMSQEDYKLLDGVSPETIALFGEMLGLDSQGDEASDKVFQEFIRRGVANRSAMKRMLHRKGIAGFSEDAGRVLAGFIYSNGRRTASNLHTGDITQAVADIPKEQGELKDAAVKLREYVSNPIEEAQAFRGILFAQYLGGSVASAMVNATQPFTVTLPWLSQFGGARKAAARIAAAARDATRDSTGDVRLDAAMKKAEEDGIVSPQEVHALQAQAQGRAQLRSGDGTRAGDAAAMASNAMSRLGLAWGKVFGVAEQFNRRTTYIAAFRTAVEQGISRPDDFARRAVVETQFTYNKGNKPRWARGAVGSILFTFKQYSVNYVEMLVRLANAGEPGSPERAAGQRAALLALGVLFLLGGAEGLPFVEDVQDVVDGALQRMGYNVSTNQKMKEFFAKQLGKGGSDFVMNGLSGIPGVPIDVSGRMGMGNLIPGTGIFHRKDNYSRDLMELAGPGGDFVKRGFVAAEAAIAGDLGKAATTMAPVAARNVFKGVDMANTGMYRDERGRKVIDTTGGEAIAKALGFQPRDVAEVQQATYEVQRQKSTYILASSQMREKWARAIFEGDKDLLEEARNDMRSWNEKNPEQRITPNMVAIRRRVAEMRKGKAERVADTAPKAIRQEARRQLEESL